MARCGSPTPPAGRRGRSTAGEGRRPPSRRARSRCACSSTATGASGSGSSKAASAAAPTANGWTAPPSTGSRPATGSREAWSTPLSRTGKGTSGSGRLAAWTAFARIESRPSPRRRAWGRIVATRLPAYSRSDSTRVLSLHADRSGEIWLGGNFKLAREAGGRFTYVPGADSDHQAMVDAIAADAAGNLWITQFGGASAPPHVLRLRHGAWTAFGASSGLPGYRCRAVHGDAAGRVWLGFEDGEVAVYEGGAFRVYAAKDGLPDGRVLTITSDRAGRVWIGGEGGLSRFDHGRFVTLTRDNGLPGSSVAGIVEDDDGFLWLAGSLAILRVRPQELEKAATSLAYRLHGEAFDATDGLRGLPRHREPYPTAARAADGRLWFATTGGVAVIDPRRLPRNLVPPPVTIEAVAADAQMLAAVPGLRLRPHTRELEFHYAALSLTAPERVRFLYKLEGYDDRWHGPIGSREIRFTNLAPRSYRFRLVACNNDGVWNAAGAALGFSIMPAYYQTGWVGLP